ncbi:MAG: 5-(carboxyamino)imidazole ribonucleotide synthase [Planctomycetaceae bacterium]|nr:5-(carboxyamino)imidazole ribonucleotide synthase [Planctomycetaceae bacterium]
MSRAQPILPGATLGILGSGQLGRMFAIAARRLGYRVVVLSPDDDTPTGQVADEELRADYLDLDRIADFARQVDVVSFEFENVPAATTTECEKYVPVRPAGQVLFLSQNRLREKGYLRDAGLPVTPFVEVRDLATLHAGLAEFGVPAVLKTADWGYDGKGQVLIRQLDDAASAWAQLASDRAILEAFIDFECELSVVAARGMNREVVTYGPMLNAHSHHILDISIAPAPLDGAILREAREVARTVLEKMDVVGVMCIEFFLTKSGRLLINETAPRPHNSGHLTIDAHVTCQFEQQVRAVCGLPLGSARQHRPAAMANLLGDLWEPHPPNWSAACALQDVKLHLYGKREARKGRKMGHMTVLADTAAEAEQRIRAARAALHT